MDALASVLSQFNVGYTPSLKTLSDFTNIDEHVLDHLKKVYLTLTALIGLSAFGAYFQIVTNFNTSLSSFLSFVFLIALSFTSFTGSNIKNRLFFAGMFAFFEGVSIGTLIQYVIDVDPKIITTALFATTLVFICFTGMAMLSPRRSYLYLGSYLGFSIFFMLFASLFNIFFRSSGINWLLLYGGLVVFMTYIIYDTQIIIEKAYAGSGDFVNHSLELFIDFLAVFVRLLIILSNKEKKKKNQDQ